VSSIRGQHSLLVSHLRVVKDTSSTSSSPSLPQAFFSQLPPLSWPLPIFLLSKLYAQYDRPLLLLSIELGAIALSYTFAVFHNTALQVSQHYFGRCWGEWVRI